MDDSRDDALLVWIEQASLAESISAAERLRDEGHGRLILDPRRFSFRSPIFAGMSAITAPSPSGHARDGLPISPRKRCSRSPVPVRWPAARRRSSRSAISRSCGTAPPGRRWTRSDTKPPSIISRGTCALVLRETGLLPHVNPGNRRAGPRWPTCAWYRPARARRLVSSSARLCEPGGVHYGSPDKRPEARLETLRLAGELRVPFTTGI